MLFLDKRGLFASECVSKRWSSEELYICEPYLNNYMALFEPTYYFKNVLYLPSGFK